MATLRFIVLRSRPVQALIRKLKRVVLPGFEGVSLFDSMSFFGKEIFSNKFNSRANAVSFSFLMGLPPLLLFFFTLVPYLPLPENKIIKVLTDILVLLAPGPKMQQSIIRIIHDFITHKKTVLLSFSVLLTMFYSSNGMMGLMKSFEKQLPGFKQRHPVRQRVIAILLTFLLIFTLILTLSFLVFQAWVASGLGLAFLKKLLVIRFVTYTIIALFCFITVSFTYKFGTATVNDWKLVSPGSIIATVLIILSTALFFYVVNNLVNYNRIYGSIGTLIIFLVWINFMAQILLIGFELNASIIVHRKGKKNPDIRDLAAAIDVPA